MNKSVFCFYLGFGMQLFGLATVGLCLWKGLNMGDYGRIELTQFILGSGVFYFGHFIKARA
jgi:hypothetical protein